MHARAALLVLLFVVAAPLAAHTVDALENGSFDNGLMPWAIPLDALSTFDWTLGEDANGSAASRSAEIGIRAGTNATRTFLYQCIRIDAARVYEAGVRVFIPPGGGEISATLAVRWFSNSECSGNPLTRFLPATSVTRQGTWIDARLRSLTAAPGATHAAFVLEVSGASTPARPARARFDDAYFVAAGDRQIIPAAASVRGASNSAWSSDLYLVNHSEAPLKATLLYRCLGACSMKPREVTVAARQSMLLPDVVARLFESPGSSGAVEIFSDGLPRALVATSRLNSAAERGTFGAEIPALRESDLAQSKLFAGIRNGTDFRTNVGIYNAAEHETIVTISLHVDGTEIARSEAPVAARTLLHVNAFHVLGVPQFVTDRAYLRVVARGALVAPFVSVIDNATNDVAYSNGVKVD